MNKFFTIALVCLIFAPFSSFAADLDVGTHASFFLPPEGGGNTLMTGIDAAYHLNDTFSARGSVDDANYTTSEHKYSLTTISLDLLYHALGKNNLDPYVGGGAVYVEKSTDGIARSTTGLNAIAGVQVVFQTFSVGLEVKYTVPDASHMETVYYSAGGQFNGAMHVQL